jgi:hypothetical protein
VLRRAPYSPCKLYYDGHVDVLAGDYLLTPGGSAYLIQSVRVNRNRPYRRHLGCLRWPKGEIPPDARVHALHWYVRRKAAMRRLKSLAAARVDNV